MKRIYLLLAIFVLCFSTVTPHYTEANVIKSKETIEEVVVDGMKIKFVTEKNEEYTIITVFEGDEINVVKMENETKNLYLNDDLIPQESMAFMLNQAKLYNLDFNQLNPELSLMPMSIDPGPNSPYKFNFHTAGTINVLALSIGVIAAAVAAVVGLPAALIIGAGLAAAILTAVSVDRYNIQYTQTRYKHESNYMDFLSYFSFYSMDSYGDFTKFIGNFTIYH